ncbi:metal ABC transporter solute-binding protein, Zn/Mn family [Mycobacterium canetti]|uniref:metal ABC transporter solute-binding protein, Zn/Mn family n=1 Tax=Mycobacterium canetti TaxID=78331 RepID=UPI0003471C32
MGVPRALDAAASLLRATLVSLIGSIALIGCGTEGPAHPGAVDVVTSTDVWGSVARAVTGGHVPVKSILTGAHADPHSYQASPADAAAIVDAELVIYNGGGYDPWVDQVLAGHPGVQAVDAYSLLGAVGDDDAPNEHVFYDPNVAKAVAATIADRLADLDPSNSGNYRANAAEFSRDADAIAISEHAIATTYPDAAVIATEPVVHYLLAAAGLKNRTPATFIAANENGNDPTPADMAAVLDMIAGREVAALLVNPQTPTAATDELQVAARRAGVPITEVTETLPSGTDYLTWQRNTVDQLTAALRLGSRQ